MPHTSSAKKSLRQIAKRRVKNKVAKKAIRVQLKKVDEVADEGTLDQLKVEYNTAAMKLDKAAAKKIIHKNTAARKKSQLAKLVNGKAKAAKA